MGDDVFDASGGLLADELRKTHEQGNREKMSDQALIVHAPGPGDPRHEMEMQRRLKNAVEKLTDQTMEFNRSSHALISNLTKEIVVFRESSDAAAVKVEKLTIALKRYTVWLVGLTVFLVLLAGVTVALTVVLINLSKQAESVPVTTPSHVARSVAPQQSTHEARSKTSPLPN